MNDNLFDQFNQIKEKQEIKSNKKNTKEKKKIHVKLRNKIITTLLLIPAGISLVFFVILNQIEIMVGNEGVETLMQVLILVPEVRGSEFNDYIFLIEMTEYKNLFLIGFFIFILITITFNVIFSSGGDNENK